MRIWGGGRIGRWQVDVVGYRGGLLPWETSRPFARLYRFRLDPGWRLVIQIPPVYTDKWVFVVEIVAWKP